MCQNDECLGWIDIACTHIMNDIYMSARSTETEKKRLLATSFEINIANICYFALVKTLSNILPCEMNI